jgi:hypothetical protein
MNTLKSKLPKIEINKNDYDKNSINQSISKQKKEKYLDDLLSKEFITNYFSKHQKRERNKIE